MRTFAIVHPRRHGRIAAEAPSRLLDVAHVIELGHRAESHAIGDFASLHEASACRRIRLYAIFAQHYATPIGLNK